MKIQKTMFNNISCPLISIIPIARFETIDGNRNLAPQF